MEHLAHREWPTKVIAHNHSLTLVASAREGTHGQDGIPGPEWACGKTTETALTPFVDLSLSVRQWHPTPVLLPGKSHGWRSLVGRSPWGDEESDTTERLYFHFSLSCIGEGNGNPLQCSCLENPRDGGAWWAAVYGVAQSWTRLK